MNERTPYDGQPYYCATCCCGLGEFMACEEVDCLLETKEAAVARADLSSKILEARSQPPVASFSSFDELMAYLDAPSDPAKDAEEKR